MPRRSLSFTVLPDGKVRLSIAVLGALIFSKFFYMASLNTYYTFYLIHKFQLSGKRCGDSTADCA